MIDRHFLGVRVHLHLKSIGKQGPQHRPCLVLRGNGIARRCRHNLVLQSIGPLRRTDHLVFFDAVRVRNQGMECAFHADTVATFWSTMILSSVETAALVACWRRAVDCENAARLAWR